MKQIMIGKSVAYAATPAVLTDATAVPDGAFGFYNLSDYGIITSKPTANFCIVLGRGANNQPLVFPEVDVKSLTIQKAEYTAGTKFSGTITINSVVAGKHYTIMVVKKGVVRHERNTWTATSMAKDSTVATVIDDLVKQFNASTETSGIKATKAGGAITITAVKEGEDYELVGADELTGVKATSVTVGKSAILDKTYVKDLASRCAAGKGFNYTAQDASEIYPGYPETVADTEYVMYTLRFAVPRVSAKQRDEVVYQIVHLVLPSTAGAIATLDTIFSGGDAIEGTSLDDED